MLVEALKYHKLYQLETDSLYNAEKERAVGEIRAKYDMERQENEIKQNRLELLEKENKMTIAYSRIYLYLHSCLFTILLILQKK